MTTVYPANDDSEDNDNEDNNNSNNSVKIFVIYVRSQGPQGQLQTQHSVDTGNYIADRHNIYKFQSVKNSICDILPCSRLKVDQNFGGNCRLHLLVSLLSTSFWFLVWLILRSCRWRRPISPKLQLTISKLHGFISQEIDVFIITAVRTSNFTV
jgi:hypothetical protein